MIDYLEKIESALDDPNWLKAVRDLTEAEVYGSHFRLESQSYSAKADSSSILAIWLGACVRLQTEGVTKFQNYLKSVAGVFDTKASYLADTRATAVEHLYQTQVPNLYSPVIAACSDQEKLISHILAFQSYAKLDVQQIEPKSNDKVSRILSHKNLATLPPYMAEPEWLFAQIQRVLAAGKLNFELASNEDLSELFLTLALRSGRAKDTISLISKRIADGGPYAANQVGDFWFYAICIFSEMGLVSDALELTKQVLRCGYGQAWRFNALVESNFEESHWTAKDRVYLDALLQNR